MLNSSKLSLLTEKSGVVVYDSRALKGGGKELLVKSFGRLLRTLRGVTPRAEIADRTRLDEPYLARIEGGRTLADEVMVRHILAKGFGLARIDVARLVLGLQLYDLGLRDPELRLLVVDLITKSIPVRVREELVALYRGYTKP